MCHVICTCIGKVLENITSFSFQKKIFLEYIFSRESTKEELFSQTFYENDVINMLLSYDARRTSGGWCVLFKEI
jgi:hypothetical protein